MVERRREKGDGRRRREKEHGKEETEERRQEKGDRRKETVDWRKETGERRGVKGDGRKETGDGRRERVISIEDTVHISLQKHRHPRCHQLRHLFPVCITVLWVLGSYMYRHIATAVYIQQPEQLYRQGKVTSFDDDGVVPYASIMIYLLSSYPKNLALLFQR